MNNFESYVYEPIDLCACYEPMFEAPADFVEEWYREHGLRNPFSCKVTHKIGNTWYIVETECDGDEPLPHMVKRLIFRIRRQFNVDKTGRSCYNGAMHYGTVS